MKYQKNPCENLNNVLVFSFDNKHLYKYNLYLTVLELQEHIGHFLRLQCTSE